jgi:hypothetical protein
MEAGSKEEVVVKAIKELMKSLTNVEQVATK